MEEDAYMANAVDDLDVPELASERDESDTDYVRRCISWAIEHAVTDEGRVDREIASQLLARLAKRNAHLLYLIINNALLDLCYRAIGDQMRHERRGGWRQLTDDGQRIISESIEADSAPDAISFAPAVASVALAPPRQHVAPIQNTSMYSGLGRSVLDLYTLPGRTKGESIRLGDARRNDLRAAIADAERNVRGNARNALFWGRIAQRLPDDETSVRASLSEEDVSLLAAGSERDIDGIMQSTLPALTD